MKRNRKLLCVLITLWIMIFVSLYLIDHFALRFPEKSIHPQITNNYSDRRLIPPTLDAAKSAAKNAKFSDLIDILGAPNYDSTMLSSIQASWDLQLGYIVTFTQGADDSAEILRISKPFASTRWLIFPAILMLVLVVEIGVYAILKKKN